MSPYAMPCSFREGDGQRIGCRTILRLQIKKLFKEQAVFETR